MHEGLEAKLLGPADMALSLATEFIENSDDNAMLGADARKQDCELKALSRLLPGRRCEYPQLRLCLSRDGLHACGRTLQLAQDHHCNYLFVFKQGPNTASSQEFHPLLKSC